MPAHKVARCGQCRPCLNPSWKKPCLAAPGAAADDGWAAEAAGAHTPPQEQQEQQNGQEQREHQQEQQQEQQQQLAAEHPDSFAARLRRHLYARDDRRVLLFTSNYKWARRQHLYNLLALLRVAAMTRDWARLAAVASVLMACDTPENYGPVWAHRHAALHARTAEALEAGWRMLQALREPLTLAQQKAYLARWESMEVTEAGRQAVRLEEARVLLRSGDVNYAFDTAVTGQPEAATPGLAHARAWLGAGIKWRQWEEAMAAVAARLGRSADQEGSGFEPWQHNSVLWARAGRGAREMADEAAALCRTALAARPEATAAAHMLAQLLMAAGRPHAALDVAAQQVLAAPADLDAARLQLSLLLAQGGAQGSAGMAGEGDDDAEGMDIDSAGAEEEGGAAEHVPQQEGRGGGSSDGSSSTPAQLAEHVAALLTADPSDPSPLVLLLALHAEGVARGGRGLPPGVLSAGLAAYLDGQPPNWCPPALELVAWQQLSSTLVGVAEAVCAAQDALQVALARRRDAAAAVAAEAHQDDAAPSSSAAAARQPFPQLSPRVLKQLVDAAGAGRRASVDMARAAADWRACCAVAEAHTWWQQAHLLPHPTRTVATQLRAWGADPPALAALAGVAAFMHPAWRQVQLARAARGEQVSATGVSEPRLSTNLLTSSVAEGLEGWGLGQEAARLRTAMAACQRAARLVGAPGGPRSTSSGTFVAAAARSAGRQRADFWRAAKRLWQPPPGWEPIPLEERHPRLGFICSPPVAWWKVFPQVMRRDRPPPQQQQVEGAPHAAAAPTARLASGVPGPGLWRRLRPGQPLPPKGILKRPHADTQDEMQAAIGAGAPVPPPAAGRRVRFAVPSQ